MAAFWEGLVCGVHNADNWEFAQSGDTYGLPLLFIVDAVCLLIVSADGWMRYRICGIRYLQDDLTRPGWKYIGTQDCNCWVWGWNYGVSTGCYPI